MPKLTRYVQVGAVSDEEDDDQPEPDQSELLTPATEPTQPEPALGVDLHASHVPFLRCKGVFTWCRRCGSYTQGGKLRSLKRVCVAPGPSGQKALYRISRGMPPCTRTKLWGDE